MTKITRLPSQEPNEEDLAAGRLKAMADHYRQAQEDRAETRKERLALFVLVVVATWGAWMTIQIVFGPIPI